MAINKSKLFKTAWQMAKGSAKRLGGKAIEYLSDGLKRAWKSAKQAVADVQRSLNSSSRKFDGDKDVMGKTVTFKRFDSIRDTFYGRVAEFIFEDAKGNVLAWSTKLSGYVASKMEAGKTYKIDFNIKNRVTDMIMDINYVGFSK
ncbi:hypothetical protein PSR33_05785 [Latilactobacillus curvatus]|uniref:Uncharacterized protein n=1 Tax=Latilactobacillus curvatus TaxID=28038 RepID=A0AAJ5RH27_LATCU|nr:hypothetical protein [Latilactobacillus curvatus]WDC91698.1 hypothetical protein PSR33_05785 [Latilactobacillus curvatus]